jgi:diaminopimelate decarboxylase
MNDLIRPSLYGAWHTIRPVQDNEGAQKVYDIVGPVCESGDTFAKERRMHEVRDGDLIAIETAGAYGAAMSSYYNARPPATEIMVDGDTHRLIYKPPTIEEWIEREVRGEK